MYAGDRYEYLSGVPFHFHAFNVICVNGGNINVAYCNVVMVPYMDVMGKIDAYIRLLVRSEEPSKYMVVMVMVFAQMTFMLGRCIILADGSASGVKILYYRSFNSAIRYLRNVNHNACNVNYSN